MQNHLRVDVRANGHATVLAVAGELDLASSPTLEEALDAVTETTPELLILDLSALEFMDSTGLSVLVRAHQRALEAGRRFALVKGGSQVQRLLSLTGIDDRIVVAESPEQLLDGS